MGREWKPGDVAMVTAQWVRGVSQSEAAVKTVDGWDSLLTGAYVYHGDVLDARPLVVIDPEDREQVERLNRLYWDTVDAETAQADMQAALREFANPTPPRPVEPTGLGAVVEDANGMRWTRSNDAGEWFSGDGNDVVTTFDQIAAVRVLSEGVTNE